MSRSNIIILTLFLFAINSFLSVLQGCHKEDNAIEEESFIMTNISDADAFELGNLVKISIDIKENKKGIISEVKVLIDDMEVSSSQSFPFDFEWDTQVAEKGNHSLKIISLNNEGKSYSDEFVVRTYVVNKQACPGTPTVTDYEGNIYNTIQIGNQCWMKENLKVSHFPDGTPLLNGAGAENTRFDYVTKYYFDYDDDDSYVDAFGRLYNWMAAVNGESTEVDLNPSLIQGICPDGWHLPSDSEWKELEMYLGMPREEADDRDWRGTIEGGMLKESGTDQWQPPNTGATNESGFTALPTGFRTLQGEYTSIGTEGSFWSSTNHIAYTDTQNPAFRLLKNDDPRTWRYRGFHGYITFARSIRCVKDL